MKLITAIVNKKDAASVCDALRKDEIFFTKLATSGGFLRDGNTTLLIGVENEKVEDTMTTLRTHCKKRMEQIPAIIGTNGNNSAYNYTTTQVAVGGATVFISDVEHFEKL